MLSPIFSTKIAEEKAGYGRFVIEPLHASFGNSLGNSLRRTLLSSLPGAAVSYVKINEASHLFTTISGIKESVLDIVLNLKQLHFIPTGKGPFKISLRAKGAKKIYGKDIEGEIPVVNKDLYLAELTDNKAELELEAIVELGYGYVPAEEKEKKEAGYITVDSAFSPVRKVNFRIENARVGRKTNFERLIIEVWTDESISPAEAMKQAANILGNHFTRLLSGEDAPATETAEVSAEASEEAKRNAKIYETIIDELNLPSRVINALLRENIETVADLVKRGKENLVGLKGVGKKSIDLIEDELKKMGINLT